MNANVYLLVFSLEPLTLTFLFTSDLLGLHAILEAQKTAILSVVDHTNLEFQSNSLKLRLTSRRKLASEVQPENYVFKKRGQ